MKKWHWMSAVGVAALSVATMAYAATLSNGSGQSCGESLGTWHFVNNQNQGIVTNLDACFSSGCTSGVQASAVNRSTAHYYVTAAGSLVSAQNGSPGKIVLSDFTCDAKCTDPKVCGCTDPKGCP